jgi:WD40 repeat protein
MAAQESGIGQDVKCVDKEKMRLKNILIIALAIFLTGVSCQVQTPAVQPTMFAPSIPAPTATESPVVQPTTLNADNLSNLQKSASLQASTGELTCSWSSDSNLVNIMGITKAGLYKTDTLELTSEFSVNETSVLYDVSPDTALAAYSLDGVKIQLYDFITKTDRLSITPDFQFGNVNFTPDGHYLAVDSNDLVEVVFFDTVTGKRVKSLSGFETAAPVYNTEFSPDGSYLLWISRGTAQPMEISSKILKPALSHEDFISAARMSHDSSKVATTAAGTLKGIFQPLVTVWNVQNGTALWQMGNVDYFSSLDFSPDDMIIAAGSMNEVVFYDVATGKELSRLATGGQAINSLGFSPDGKSLLTCSSDGIATIWKVG